MLQHYPWPGNVRELANAVSFAVRMSRGRVLEADQLPEKIWGWRRNAPRRMLFSEELVRLKAGLSADETAQMAANFYRGNVQFPDGAAGGYSEVTPTDLEKRDELARRLGIARTTLWKRLRSNTPPK